MKKTFTRQPLASNRAALPGPRQPAASTSQSPPPPPAPPAPPGPAALAAKVRTLAPSMTRSMHRVAEAVAADPAGCAGLTVTGLAQRTGTSEATVVRTSRLLGYTGYRGLRLALAGLAAHQASGAAPAVTADIDVDDPMAQVIAKLAQDERQTLADTAAVLDATQVEAAVAALSTARRTDVYGVGASGLVAQDLAQKLLRIGRVAHDHHDPHLAVTNAVQLGPGDVAVAFSHSGRTEDVIEPLRVAFDRGATTVAVTGGPDGEISQYADHLLTTSAARESELRPAAMSSRTSQLLVVDCLFVGVAQLTYDEAAPALAASYEALAHRRHARRTR
ncbi:MurR/RpiR family transcriptional regulator [Streptomyces sp. 549]|uniref:MurR/RpiR family transcriptional regulator n=1 Tax=Streptomyces sp. 549 TaxID=3049076 RepID=UPI0024C2B087|nr:MurR/RpiR family transcriptional regulator [Streptomyces sp. 549]MDK1472488.1 MurR/RpiR family transcriptional regulator [Streptomyces sp. 549]